MATSTRLEPPLEVIARLAPLIRENADASEREATLARPLVDAFRQAGIFRHAAPASLGGGETDPITWYRTLEAAARIDGTTGWILWIQGSSGMLGRNMPGDAAEALVRDENLMISGTIFPFAKAVVANGGAVVTGKASYASGCKHASHIIMAAHLHDGDVPRMTPLGPDLRIAVMPVGQVKIVENTWDVGGLAGTGSNDIVVDAVTVPDAHLIGLVGEANRFYQGPLYRLPFLTLFGWGIAGVALGIAQHAIDATRELAGTKIPAGTLPGQGGLRDRPLFQLQLVEAEALVRSARAWLYESLGRLWELAQANQPASLDDRLDMWMAACNASRSARLAVEQMYLACGGTANYLRSPLQRCHRDIHALSQHFGTSPNTSLQNGAMLAGLPPPTPFILL